MFLNGATARFLRPGVCSSHTLQGNALGRVCRNRTLSGRRPARHSPTRLEAATPIFPAPRADTDVLSLGGGGFTPAVQSAAFPGPGGPCFQQKISGWEVSFGKRAEAQLGFLSCRVSNLLDHLDCLPLIWRNRSCCK